MDNIYFSYYPGNIRLKKSIGTVSLARFIKAHWSPTDNMLRVFKEIEKAEVSGSKKLKRRLKHSLYSFTPSVVIQHGMPRSYKNIQSWTGLMQLDFDGLDNKYIAQDFKYYIFEEFKFIYTAYLSPSRLGVKALAKINIPRDVEHYKAIHKSIEKDMEDLEWFDSATKNAVLPLFLSHDSDILYRDDPETYTKEDWSKPRYVHMNETKPHPNFNYRSDWDKNRTIAIFVNKINNIVSNGHPQVRNACLVLGSRSGAGYLSKVEAESIAVECIRANGYLSKGTRGYIDTAIWAINEGFKNPKEYKK